MRKRKSPTRREILNYLEDRRGAAAIVMAILTPVLIGGLAFGAEIGFWELEKRKLQNAVDTAAHAAGTQLRSGVTNDATLEAVAQAVATAGGFGGGDPEITLVQPPSSGAYSGNNNALNVVITETIPRRFSAIYNSDPIVVNVDATALVSAGRPACVLALHRTASGAISTGGSTTVSLSNCDIATNSMSSTAATNTGNGNSVTASCISAVGNITVDSNYHLHLSRSDFERAADGGPLRQRADAECCKLHVHEHTRPIPKPRQWRDTVLLRELGQRFNQQQRNPHRKHDLRI